MVAAGPRWTSSPELLGDVFRVEATIMTDPITGAPICVGHGAITRPARPDAGSLRRSGSVSAWCPASRPQVTSPNRPPARDIGGGHHCTEANCGNATLPVRRVDLQFTSRANAVANASRSGSPAASNSCTRVSSISS